MGVKVWWWWWWKEEQREDDRNKKERELRRPWRIRIIPLHGRGIKELIGLRGRMQGQGGEEKEKGGGGWVGGGITKMLRGPYSHSHGAQQAVIKLHYQTG